MKLGVIEEGNFKGKKIILEPRTNLPQNVWIVEKGQFFNGGSMFGRYCLLCEKEVTDKCINCNKE